MPPAAPPQWPRAASPPRSRAPSRAASRPPRVPCSPLASHLSDQIPPADSRIRQARALTVEVDLDLVVPCVDQRASELPQLGARLRRALVLEAGELRQV